MNRCGTCRSVPAPGYASGVRFRVKFRVMVMVRLHGIPGVPGVPRYDDFFRNVACRETLPDFGHFAKFYQVSSRSIKVPKTAHYGLPRCLDEPCGTGCHATDALKHTLIPWQNLSTVAGRDRT